MTRFPWLRCGIVMVGTMLVGGCATIIDGRTADVSLESVPSEAAVTVHDHDGDVVARTITPGTVSLKRGRTWLRPAKYEAVFEKEGYASAHAPIETTLNPWVLGNIIIGGGAGAVVDGVTGALWRPKHSRIEQSLAYAPQSPGSDLSPESQDPIESGPSLHLTAFEED